MQDDKKEMARRDWIFLYKTSLEYSKKELASLEMTMRESEEMREILIEASRHKAEVFHHFPSAFAESLYIISNRIAFLKREIEAAKEFVNSFTKKLAYVESAEYDQEEHRKMLEAEELERQKKIVDAFLNAQSPDPSGILATLGLDNIPKDDKDFN